MPEVILGRVQPDPGHRVLAGHVVGVIRLVLVPDQGQGYGCHRSSLGRRAVEAAAKSRGSTQTMLGRSGGQLKTIWTGER